MLLTLHTCPEHMNFRLRDKREFLLLGQGSLEKVSRTDHARLGVFTALRPYGSLYFCPAGAHITALGRSSACGAVRCSWR